MTLLKSSNILGAEFMGAVDVVLVHHISWSSLVDPEACRTPFSVNS